MGLNLSDSALRTLKPCVAIRARAVAVICLAVLPAHFLQLRNLGVYEDDFWAIVPFLYADFSTIIDHATYHFSAWMTGRPLNYILPATMAAVGSHLAGLEGVYMLSAVILMVNCLLLFEILRRFIPAEIALIGAVFYGLFPADTTKILLVHGAHVQGSMTFLLTGFVLFLSPSRIRLLSYPVASLSLLSYESAYLPFLLAPFLHFCRSKIWFRGLIVHVAFCLTTLVIIGSIRLSKGDARATAVAGGISEAIYRSATSLFIGPATSAHQMAVSPWQGLFGQDAHAWCVMAFAAIVVLLLVAKLNHRSAQGGKAVDVQPGIPGLATVMICGLLFWSIAYALTLVDPHYPPVRTLGRLTSVHVAAGFGATVALICALELIRRILPGHWRMVWAFIPCLYVAGLVGHSLKIQDGYVHAWGVSRSFWGQVLTLAPELTEGTVILVEGEQPPQSPVIASNSWADALVLKHFFKLPAGARPPILVMLENSGRLLDFKVENNQIRWKPLFWSGVETNLDPSNVILLSSTPTGLQRIPSLELPNLNQNLYSRPATGSATVIPHSGFHHIMFGRGTANR